MDNKPAARVEPVELNASVGSRSPPLLAWNNAAVYWPQTGVSKPDKTEGNSRHLSVGRSETTLQFDAHSVLSRLRGPLEQFADVRPQFLPADALACRQTFQVLRLPDRHKILVLEQGFHLPVDGRLFRGQDAADRRQVGGQELEGLQAVGRSLLGRWRACAVCTAQLTARRATSRRTVLRGDSAIFGSRRIPSRAVSSERPRSARPLPSARSSNRADRPARRVPAAAQAPGARAARRRHRRPRGRRRRSASLALSSAAMKIAASVMITAPLASRYSLSSRRSMRRSAGEKHHAHDFFSRDLSAEPESIATRKIKQEPIPPPHSLRPTPPQS